MALKSIQRKVHKWIKQYKVGYFKPHQILARLMEEVGEVAREINHRFGRRNGGCDIYHCLPCQLP